MLWSRKKHEPPAFDMTGKIPVIRTSICTGEQVAGFKDPVSGRFQELALIRDDADLRDFLRTCGVEETDIKREW